MRWLVVLAHAPVLAVSIYLALAAASAALVNGLVIAAVFLIPIAAALAAWLRGSSDIVALVDGIFMGLVSFFLFFAWFLCDSTLCTPAVGWQSVGLLLSTGAGAGGAYVVDGRTGVIRKRAWLAFAVALALPIAWTVLVASIWPPW